MNTRQRPRPGVSVEEGTITVTRAAYHRGQEIHSEEERERIEVPVFHTEPARVTVNGNVKKNMGNYESLGVSVTISLPCYPEMSEVNRVYGIASGWVDEMLPEQLKKGIQGG